MVGIGLVYALAFGATAFVFFKMLGIWAALPFALLGLLCVWFFRDPDRVIPDGPVAVSPADGKVVLVRRKPESTQISIFLNIFDVHVNRAPIGGKIVGIEYKPGKFLVASKEEASLQNEMNTFTIDGDHTLVRFSQIAGLIARRIVCWKKQGDFVTKGERVGLIQFSSRVDAHFGPEWEVTVRDGDRVKAGSSIIAKRIEAPPSERVL